MRRIKIPWNDGTPEELDAKRYRAEDREKNSWYIIVSEYHDKPVEIFTSTANDNDHRLQGRIAVLSALTRSISLMLRHVFLGERITIEKIKMQLSRSSRQKLDLPAMVLSVLENYQKDQDTGSQAVESK